MNDVTQLLVAARQGEPQALESLLPLVYDELRRIAAYKMAQEAPGHTLQPTALVHEAWLRILGDGHAQFDGRGHFFAAAAEVMRRILVDAARRRHSLKRGGAAGREELQEWHLQLDVPPDHVLAIDEALGQLGAVNPTAAELVKLRYFVGMSMEEAAAALDLPARSAGRLWAYARAWLRRKLEPLA